MLKNFQKKSADSYDRPHETYSFFRLVCSWVQFCPPGVIWQGLKGFLVVTTGRDATPSSGRLGMLANILECTGQPPQQRVIQTQMSIVENPGPENRENDMFKAGYYGLTLNKLNTLLLPSTPLLCPVSTSPPYMSL